MLHSKPPVELSGATKHYVMSYTQNHGWDCQMLPGFSTVFQLIKFTLFTSLGKISLYL